MKFFKKYIGKLFLPARFYILSGSIIVLFVTAFFITSLFDISRYLFYIFVILLFADYLFLFLFGKAPEARRITSGRFSNGDPNLITLHLVNPNFFDVSAEIIDELPYQFQKRDFRIRKSLKAGAAARVQYTVIPDERGEYDFGNIIVYMSSLLGLVMRRCDTGQPAIVPSYPSYMQLRKYQLVSQTMIQTEQGSRRMRKIGHSMEFEQIKEYVRGDDIRTINWKATARRASLMVNNYTDEKSQQVYCVIDKGRLMKMPFNNLTLLDYAVNSTLVLSNVCLQRQDKVGLITFSSKIGSILAADRKPVQQDNILQLLYKEETTFPESDYEMLYMQIRNRIKQRSLLVLFTNFESLSGLKRQLPYLRSIARHHLLLVVFFENTELSKLAAIDAGSVESVYHKTIAEKFIFEKRLIVKELSSHGILSVYTSPEHLTINAINKYLELKARQAV